MKYTEEATVINLLDILDLSKDDSEHVKDEIKKQGLVRFVNNVDHGSLSEDVCEKMKALNEILTLVQENEAFHSNERGDLYDH